MILKKFTLTNPSLNPTQISVPSFEIPKLLALKLSSKSASPLFLEFVVLGASNIESLYKNIIVFK
jgi:hypothetical protein